MVVLTCCECVPNSNLGETRTGHLISHCLLLTFTLDASRIDAMHPLVPPACTTNLRTFRMIIKEFRNWESFAHVLGIDAVPLPFLPINIVTLNDTHPNMQH